MPIQDSELIQSFLTESMEMLDDAEPKLIDLQRVADSTGAVDNEMVNSIFRAFHSIKGSAGFLQMKNISAVTHEAETLLDRFRKGKSRPTPESIDILFRACDVIRKLLGSVEKTQGDEGCGPEVAAVGRRTLPDHPAQKGIRRRSFSAAARRIGSTAPFHPDG